MRIFGITSLRSTRGPQLMLDDEVSMRTTLSIADDVLLAAKAIAKTQRKTVGDVVSDLARQSLAKPNRALKTRNGILILPTRDRNAVVSIEIVNALRDGL